MLLVRVLPPLTDIPEDADTVLDDNDDPPLTEIEAFVATAQFTADRLVPPDSKIALLELDRATTHAGFGGTASVAAPVAATLKLVNEVTMAPNESCRGVAMLTCTTLVDVPLKLVLYWTLTSDDGMPFALAMLSASAVSKAMFWAELGASPKAVAAPSAAASAVA